MPVDKFLIAPLNSGIQQDVDPWLIMDDAYEELKNMHVWRGKLMKRYGSSPMNPLKAAIEQQLFSRFRLKIGTTLAVSGDFAATIVPGAIWKIGQLFSIGSTIFTVRQANGAMYSTGAATGTYNIATGIVSITGNTENPLTDIYFYPAEPAMKLARYDTFQINNEQTIGFDTQFAYTYAKATGWQSLGPVPSVPIIPGDAQWSGTNSDFYWVTNWRGVAANDFILFATNNIVADQIKYYNGSVAPGTWTNFSPTYNAGGPHVIRTAKVVIPFKERLLLMNTTEQIVAGDAVFQNRIRYSKVGSPIAVDSFYEQAGLGDFIDITTREAIISAGIVKDRMIIFCEKSTYELVYTGNQILPFVIQNLNNELGVESMNSLVPFDKLLLGFGSSGINMCDGLNVERIDNKIPYTIFSIHNKNDGPERVVGIRNFYTEECYFSFPSSDKSNDNAETFPNQVLVYNYRTQSFALNDDSITAFGYYQDNDDVTWAGLNTSWQAGNERWEDASQTALFLSTIAGNQHGITYVLNNNNTNAQSLSITDVINFAGHQSDIIVEDHNLSVGDFVYINNCTGITNINNAIFRVHSVANERTFRVLTANPIVGFYDGGGTIAIVSKPFVLSKRYNFYTSSGKKSQLLRTDFLIDTVENGELTFEYHTSFSNRPLQADAQLTGTALGASILDMKPIAGSYEVEQEKIWRSIYPFAEGDTVQYELTLTDNQMRTNNIAESDIVIHAIMFHVRPTDDIG